MTRILFSWFLVMGLSLMAWGGQARGEDSPPFETKALQAILIDARGGHVLYEKDADTPIPPASMSKLMTMIMVFEALKAGSLKIDQEIVISEDAWRRGGASSGGSTMYAVLNSRVKLSDLIQGVIVQSANDASIAIAEAMAGSEAAFAQKMTARARKLGLAKAEFRNATGLPDPGHRISVRELSILARYIILNFPDYYKYYSEPSFTWNNIAQDNRNPLLKDYPGADGMKTGYTKEAGYGLVGSAVRNNRRLIMVIAGLKSPADRKQEAQKLLDWGFSQFREIDVYAKGDRIGQATVWGGSQHSVDLVTANDVKIALSPNEQETAEAKLSYTGPLMAPVKAGQKVGSIRFLVGGEVVAEEPVVAAADVPASSSMWSKALDSVLIMVFGR
ncbi:MAG: D-alanyl-D-alanine carboxypeptidase [Rhizobiales bacterium]|nr:D-alanyl-D-alanine carboxypeptidase [Hyphomicrobiales bacterium]MBI3672178.1 D-alanyl-D-alanine carboxypeptidase [Hyphomicrobiales bacterium]